ncbi:MAG: hypothetical protein HYX24_04685 [Candidatus Aenigmarchaeota archaeon]|nr:hypothetical protein [Candidatus Aenigmarchaeota archaeon]
MFITLPDFDLVTSYASAWSAEVIDIAERNGMKITAINGRNVTKSSIETNIKSKNPKFLSFVGHGSDTVICGHDNEPLIVLGENESLLASKIVHAFTCSSAARLGKECNSSAFIGYGDLFWLYMDRNRTAKPLEDELARPFMESAIEAPRQLAKKKTAGEAFAESQRKYQKWIDELTLSSSKHTAEELQVILPLLHFNKNCQMLHGNPHARV